jgi:hypothetical protein
MKFCLDSVIVNKGEKTNLANREPVLKMLKNGHF